MSTRDTITSPRLGIAFVTYNRLSYLKACVESVRTHTRSEACMVVCDDGSQDGTRAYCQEIGLPVVGSRNRGVCWNKNRGLWYLAAKGCSTILLVEDDTLAVEPGWEAHWVDAIARWGHVSYLHPKLRSATLSGAGTADDPFVNNKATAQCSGVSESALQAVGYFDSRFKGYGVGHAEWTSRIKSAGFGFQWVALPDGRRARANLYIDGGIVANDAPTFRDRETVARNELLFEALKQEPIHRLPWTSEEERLAFLDEMRDVLDESECNRPAIGAAPAAPMGSTPAPELRAGKGRKACILLCGIDRSSSYTLDSIVERVIAPSREIFDEVRVIARFNVATALNNPRSGETGEAAKPRRAPQLKALCDRWHEDPQEQMDISSYRELLSGTEDFYRDGRRSYDNLAYAMENAARLWQDVADSDSMHYDVYFLLRIDLLYLTSAEIVGAISAICRQGVDLLTPTWHRHGGVNDRVAVGNLKAMRCILNRRDALPDFVRSGKPLHAESFMADVVNAGGLAKGKTGLVGVRVRSTGQVDYRDLKMLDSRGLPHPPLPSTRPAENDQASVPTPEAGNAADRREPSAAEGPEHAVKTAWTSRRIARLFEHRSLGNYLEIGVSRGHTFLEVSAGHKVAVDPRFRFDTSAHESDDVRFHPCPSDEYFTRHWDGRAFDLIFIDGLHVFEQVLRDLLHAMRAAHPRTLFLIDDTVPVDVYSAVPDQRKAIEMRLAAGGTSRAWHGDVYKLVLFMHDFLPQLSYVTLTENGNPQTLAWFEPRIRHTPAFPGLEALSRVDYFTFVSQYRSLLKETSLDEALDRVRSFFDTPPVTPGHAT